MNSLTFSDQDWAQQNYLFKFLMSRQPWLKKVVRIETILPLLLIQIPPTNSREVTTTISTSKYCPFCAQMKVYLTACINSSLGKKTLSLSVWKTIFCSKTKFFYFLLLSFFRQHIAWSLIHECELKSNHQSALRLMKKIKERRTCIASLKELPNQIYADLVPDTS